MHPFPSDDQVIYANAEQRSQAYYVCYSKNTLRRLQKGGDATTSYDNRCKTMLFKNGLIYTHPKKVKQRTKLLWESEATNEDPQQVQLLYC
jgi:hypothetical protein